MILKIYTYVKAESYGDKLGDDDRLSIIFSNILIIQFFKETNISCTTICHHIADILYIVKLIKLNKEARIACCSDKSGA